MDPVKITITRTPEEILHIQENQLHFINAIRGEKAFLRRVAADFIKKKNQHESSKSTTKPL